MFDMVLSEQRPAVVVVVDAVDVGREPGEVFEMPLDMIPAAEVSEFSPHQAPTLNLLKDLKEGCKVKVVVIACQMVNAPQEVHVGLSSGMAAAVNRAAELITNRFLREPDLDSKKG